MTLAIWEHLLCNKKKAQNCIFRRGNETSSDEADTKMLHFNFTANGLFSFYCTHRARCRPLLFYCVILHLILLFLQGITKHLDNWIKLSSKKKSPRAAVWCRDVLVFILFVISDWCNVLLHCLLPKKIKLTMRML